MEEARVVNCSVGIAYGRDRVGLSVGLDCVLHCEFISGGMGVCNAPNSVFFISQFFLWFPN